MKCFVSACDVSFSNPQLDDSESEQERISAHRFPKDLSRRIVWIQSISKAENRAISVDSVNVTIHRVCSKHFLESDFYYKSKGRRLLHQSAIPTVFDSGARKLYPSRVHPKKRKPAELSEPFRIRQCSKAAQQETRELIDGVLACIATPDGQSSSSSTAPTVFRLEKFPRVCRLCLKPPKSRTQVMVPLDTTNDDGLDGISIGQFIADILLPTEAFLDQDMEKLLPNMICLPCLELLRFFAKYRSKVATVHMLMNSLIELKQLNSGPIIDLFSTRADPVRTVIKDLGLCRMDDFSVQDLLDEFPRYDLACFEGVVKESKENLCEDLDILLMESNTFKTEEMPSEELNGLTKDNPDIPAMDCSDDLGDYKEKRPAINSKCSSRKLDEPLQCSKCSYSTFYERIFKKHQTTHEKRAARVYRCKAPGCSEEFKTRKEYKRHGAMAHKTFVCDTCGLRSATPSALTQHMARHLMTLEHPCPYCKRRFNGKSDLRNHVRAAHLPKEEYPCETCGMTFHKKHVLDAHRATHSDSYDFPCTLCDKKFKVSNNLKRHIATVHEKVRLSCTYCDTQFVKSTKLNDHIESVHGIQTRFVCDVCVQTFGSQDLLDSHRARHDSPHELECGTCLIAFTSKDLFSEHLCITYRADYVCCGRDLRYHYMYNKHMLIKHGLKTNARVKPVPGVLMGQMRAQRKRIESCPKCEQIFATRSQKKQHMEICAVVEERNGGVGNPVTADVPMV